MKYFVSYSRGSGTIKTLYHSSENNSNVAASDTVLGRYTLEPNLTQYIFFDDGTYDSMDTGGFASKLAEKISTGARRKVPLVTILVGADLQALKLIFADLESNIPVLIVDSLLNRSHIIIDMFKSTKNQNEELTKRDGHHDDTEDDIDTHLLGLPVGKTVEKPGEKTDKRTT
ncbi:unnamed protein product [Adineta steineri]|uniref:Uncharacterized protein n=1 Tax=Adineta steineri TaxID=433720 RepID=A0A819Q4Y5_9BILA|nr:unnamed protein product [Adineta steineri]